MTDQPSFADRIAAGPISWGVCEVPGWGLQLDVDRVLSEARGLGITAMEQGALGWLPTDPDAQRAKLDEYGVQLLGGFVPLVLHDPEQREPMLAQAGQVAANMKAAGGSYFVTAAVASLDDWSRPELSEAAWDELFANLERVEQICLAHGLHQVVHPHLDTLIETDDDFSRLLAGSSVRVCLDTGHLTIGGVDVLAVAHDHLARVGLVHLKDVDGEIAARRNAGELNLMAATRDGLFPPLGDGMVPIAEVIEALQSGGYRGWYVVETDVALTDGEPPPGEGPVRGVERSLAYLRSLELATA